MFDEFEKEEYLLSNDGLDDDEDTDTDKDTDEDEDDDDESSAFEDPDE